MATSKELRALIVLAGKIDPSMQSAMLKATAETKKLSNAAKSTGSAFAGMIKKASGIALAYVGFTTAKDFLTGAMKSAEDNEKAMAQLGAVIKSTGGAAGMSAQSVMDLADKLNLSSTFTKGQIMQSENLLLTFTKIGKDVFPAASKAALNMSTALGKDTKSSAIQLGKALNDPITGMTALRRSGVSFTTQQQDQIKALQKSGNLLGAQKLILAELNKEFGGSTKAQASTMAGRIALMEKQFASFQKKVGIALLPVAENLLNIGLKAMPYVTKGITLIVDYVKWWTGVLKADVIPIVIKVADKLKQAFKSPIVQGAIKWLADTGLPAIKQACIDVFNKGKELYNFISDNWSTIKPLIEGIALAWGLYATKLAIAKSVTLAASAAQWLMTTAQWALNVAMNANPIGLVITLMGLLVGAGILLYQNWDIVSTKFHDIWVSIKNFFIEGVNGCIDLLNDLIDAINYIPGVSVSKIQKLAIDTSSSTASVADFKRMEYQNNGSTQKAGKPKTQIPGPFVGTNNKYVALPGYASGGIANRPSIFGEAGLEIAIPLERTPRSLGLLNQTAQMLGAGGREININIQVYAPSGEAQSIGSTVKDAVKDVIEEYFEGKARVSYGY